MPNTVIAVVAKLTTKPMTIEDIITYSYSDEIGKDRRLKERPLTNRAAIAAFFV